MRPFLRQVAEHYYNADGGRLADRCFIFPNRRSLVFFQRYLGECVRNSETPVIAPAMYTINDFFYAVSRQKATPKVRLLLDLYSCYDSLRRSAGMLSEPLDEFVFWGDVILSDFNEIDKYLIDPAALLRNVADLKSMQDDFSYLSEEQIRAMEQFISHFRKDDGAGQGGVKDSFLQIWQMLLPLYGEFNRCLDDKGRSYEGMVYRRMAGRLRDGASVIDLLTGAFAPQTRYVFVGLNALNECEKTLMRRMRDAHLAEFCWDYVSAEIRDRQNMSSFFMASNVVEFPQAFDLDPVDTGSREVNVLSVPSAVGQAKQLPEILSRVSGTAAADIETAVVLPDEGMLVPVLNSIPENVGHVNVTMGYPMTGSAFFSMMDAVESMQLHMRYKNGEWMFYHKDVRAVLGSSVLKALLDDSDREIISSISRKSLYYLSQEEFAASPLLNAVFVPVVTDVTSTSEENISRLAQYQMDIISVLGRRMAELPALSLELEFARSYWQCVVSLKEECLPVLASTYLSLLHKMAAVDSVHFKGEPLRGMQVMGPLETRALDFRNLIILSCNEGVFPRHRVSASFIPHELRKAFALPTYEYQDAVWAYYFYRMIQRAERVWLVYDSRFEGVRSGEESRYVKQLEMHFGLPLKRFVASATLDKPLVEEDIPKTEEDVAAIRKLVLSASSLKDYIACPAKFYYNRVRGLKPLDELSESLDAGMIGNVFHAAMQALYTVDRGILTRPYLESLYKDRTRVRNRVRELICKELKTDEVVGRNLVLEDIICRYVHQVVYRDIEMMNAEGIDHMEILGLELRVNDYDLDGFKFVCVVDRLDRLRPGEVRVVDYKTGKVLDADINVCDGNASDTASALFSSETPSDKRPVIALQMYLYDEAVKQSPSVRGLVRGSGISNSVYSVTRLFKQPVETVPCSEVFSGELRTHISALLKEMTDTEVPFRRTDDDKTCSYCDFKMICGR